MALKGRRTNNFIELWCLVASLGLHFCVSSTSFQKIDIGWPQQPPTERVSDISKILDFWWSIPQNGTGIDHLGARDEFAFAGIRTRASRSKLRPRCSTNWATLTCWKERKFETIKSFLLPSWHFLAYFYRSGPGFRE